jgi:hypothetical protein
MYKAGFGFIFCFILFFLKTVGSQPVVDGFKKGKGDLDAVFSYTFENYSKFFTQTRKTISLGRSTHALSLFGVYGLTNRFDVQLNLPVVITGGNLSGLQDVSAYIKYAFIKKEVRGYKYHVFIASGGSVPMRNYETQSLFAVGQRAKAIDARAVFQITAPKGIFLMLQSGYIWRETPVTNAHPFSGKIGWARSSWYADLWYDRQLAFGGANYGDRRGILFRELGVSYDRMGFTFYKPFKKEWGMAAGASYVLNGRNMGKAFGISLAFIKRFKILSNP